MSNYGFQLANWCMWTSIAFSTTNLVGRAPVEELGGVLLPILSPSVPIQNVLAIPDYYLKRIEMDRQHEFKFSLLCLLETTETTNQPTITNLHNSWYLRDKPISTPHRICTGRPPMLYRSKRRWAQCQRSETRPLLKGHLAAQHSRGIPLTSDISNGWSGWSSYAPGFFLPSWIIFGVFPMRVTQCVFIYLHISCSERYDYDMTRVFLTETDWHTLFWCCCILYTSAMPRSQGERMAGFKEKN
jgi:hypothetical protein